MEWLAVLLPFVLLGTGVLFVAFSGGPAAAREAYLTRGGRLFKFVIPLIYVGIGIAVPAAVIADKGETEGGVGPLRDEALSTRDEEGKDLFEQTCKSCHNLDAVQARGVTGPDLDELGGLDKQRVLNAIKNGGLGSGTMPANLVTGKDAQAVAKYVSSVAGK